MYNAEVVILRLLKKNIHVRLMQNTCIAEIVKIKNIYF
jgi:hypothetical protein